MAESSKNNPFFSGILVIVLLVFLFILSNNTESVFGGADSYQHYLIAHFAFKHPGLFLHYWGKPVFTLLSSPFALFGFGGMKLFNLLTMLTTGLLCSRILRKLGIAFAPIAIPLVVFTPIYFQCVFSGLTEPLFSLILIGAIALFIDKKYWFSACVLSFLPLVRTEGVMLLPLFALAYFLVKQYRAIPLLFLGILIYSVLGYFFVYHDFFWLVNEIPYTGSVAYGAGDFWHYMMQLDTILGWPLLIGFVSGLLILIFRLAQAPSKNLLLSWGLIISALLSYFLAHSYVWSQGQASSLGLTRIMAAIAPLFVLVAAVAINWFAQKPKHFLLSYGSAATVVVLVLSTTLSSDVLPGPLNFEEKAMQHMAAYLKQHNTDKKTVYFYNPSICFFAHLDLFDPSNSLWATAESDYYKPGSFVLWDAHFGPNEGGTNKERLIFNPKMEYKHQYAPESAFEVLGGHTYEVLLFEVHDPPISAVYNKPIFQSGFERDSTFPQQIDQKRYSEAFAASGQGSCELHSGYPYLELAKLPMDSVLDRSYSYIYADTHIYLPRASDREKTHLIISVEKEGKLVDYFPVKLDSSAQSQTWNQLTNDFTVRPDYDRNTQVKVYLWYEGSGTIYVDDTVVQLVKRSLK